MRHDVMQYQNRRDICRPIIVANANFAVAGGTLRRGQHAEAVCIRNYRWLRAELAHVPKVHEIEAITFRIRLTRRLSDAGMRRFKTKAVYPDHSIPLLGSPKPRPAIARTDC